MRFPVKRSFQNMETETVRAVNRGRNPPKYLRSKPRVKYVKGPRGRRTAMLYAPGAAPEVKTFIRSTLKETVVDSFLCVPALLAHTFVATGTLKNNRVGNKIRPIGLRISGVLQNNFTNAQMVRMITVRKAEAGRDLQDLNTLLFDGPSSINDAPDISLMYLPVNKDAFTVLIDKVFTLGPSAGGGTEPASSFSEYASMSGTIEYEGGASTDCVRGEVQTIFLSADPRNDVTAPGTNIVEVSACSELYFVDV